MEMYKTASFCHLRIDSKVKIVLSDDYNDSETSVI